MATRFRTIRGVRRQVRETLWFGIPAGRDTMSAASTAVLALSLNAGALALRPFTVVRTLVHMSLKSDQTAAIENYDAAFGAAVVSDQAVAIGITAVPTPMTDLASDLWLFHKILDGSFLFLDATGSTQLNAVPLGGITAESRAMRKVNADQDIVFVTETSTASSGAIMYSAGRMLIKLH